MSIQTIETRGILKFEIIFQLHLDNSKVRDCGFEPRSGIQVSKMQKLLVSRISNPVF